MHTLDAFSARTITMFRGNPECVASVLPASLAPALQALTCRTHGQQALRMKGAVTLPCLAKLKEAGQGPGQAAQALGSVGPAGLHLWKCGAAW